MATPLILAAGASTRMGVPKALLSFGGRTALDLVVYSCRAANTAPPVVVLGADADRILAAVRLPEASVVRHEGWASGRTSSLKAGLRCLDPTEAFMIFPVDHPLVHPATLTALLQALEAPDGSHQQNAAGAGSLQPRGVSETMAECGQQRGVRPGPRVIVPVVEGRRGHPVLCEAELREEFLALGDDEPARAVTGRDPGRVCEVVVADPGVLENLDTPEDYQRALERWKASSTFGPGRAEGPI